MQKTVWQKAFLLLILLMLVIGFSFPLFNLGGDTNAPQEKEPRICRTDAECYLTCDGRPVPVLCSQNLCQQNECNEPSRYPFLEQPKKVTLQVEADNAPISLVERLAEGTVFVAGEDGNREKGEVVVYGGLFLPQLLEKFGLVLSEQCLYIGRNPYCGSVEVKVNGEEEFYPVYYTPQDGDEISIKAYAEGNGK